MAKLEDSGFRSFLPCFCVSWFISNLYSLHWDNQGCMTGNLLLDNIKHASVSTKLMEKWSLWKWSDPVMHYIHHNLQAPAPHTVIYLEVLIFFRDTSPSLIIQGFPNYIRKTAGKRAPLNQCYTGNTSSFTFNFHHFSLVCTFCIYLLFKNYSI